MNTDGDIMHTVRQALPLQVQVERRIKKALISKEEWNVLHSPVAKPPRFAQYETLVREFLMKHLRTIDIQSTRQIVAS